MRYYVLPDGHGYKILKVQVEDVPLFQKRFDADIICEADTLAALLERFADLIEKRG